MVDEVRASAKAAAYVPWGTFKNAIDRLAITAPNRIDRTVFPGLAGGTQTQLLIALKFFGLMTDGGDPTPLLRKLLAASESERRGFLRSMIESSYASLFELDLMKTTPAQFYETMQASYNVSGSTLRKAVRFFLSAAEDLEIPISPLFEKAKAPGGTNGAQTKRRRTTARQRVEEDEEEDGEEEPEPTSSGMSKKIQLRSGGTLTLTASINLFALSGEDQKFVWDLIQQVNQYEAILPKG